MTEVGDVPGTVIRSRDSTTESGRAGTIDVELFLEDQIVSSCRIIPLQLRVGAAVLRMDGIGAVETAEEFRQRGFSRCVLNHALQLMEAGDAALTMLYGITNFYPKFGYITVGPESTISLPPLSGEGSLPAGYASRPFRREDLESVQHLYDQVTAQSVGTVVRSDDGYPWTALLDRLREEAEPDCRVVIDAGERVCGYVWRGRELGFVRAHSRFNPEDLVLADVVAVEPSGADAVLTVCRQWAAEEATHQGRDVRRVRFFLPHEGSVTTAAMHAEASLSRRYGPDGGWMARVLNTRRLLSSLQPELSRRLSEANNAARCTLRVFTESGGAVLFVDGDSVRVEEAAGESREAIICRLPQTTLARLAMGAYPPEDLLARLPAPPEERVAKLLRMMFPTRPAQTFLADRY